MNDQTIGIVGAGAMGAGIAQVAAAKGHRVLVYDTLETALDRARTGLEAQFVKLEQKGKIPSATELLGRFHFTKDLHELAPCGLVIEAIVERLDIKKSVFAALEGIVGPECILATNTSSLSVTAIAAGCRNPGRVIGLHFFNPAPLMALVEVIPALQSAPGLAERCMQLMQDWGKMPVLAQDTPGFIVNRLARPYYGEAIRVYEEGFATMEEIDRSMTDLGFKMGPFLLMDYIGHDVNYVVTHTVFESFFYDGRYKPSFTQKRLLDAGWLGRKSNRGFYAYDANGKTGQDGAAGIPWIADRILCLLINEAVEARHLNVASAADLDKAMNLGVNYPKGLLRWCDELGAQHVLGVMDALYETYHEERYRASALLRKMASSGGKFFGAE